MHERDPIFPVFPLPPKWGEQSSWILNLAKYSFRDRVGFFCWCGVVVIIVIVKNILLSQVSGRYSPSKMVPDIPVFIPASFLFSLRLRRGSDGIAPNGISGTQLALSVLVLWPSGAGMVPLNPSVYQLFFLSLCQKHILLSNLRSLHLMQECHFSENISALLIAGGFHLGTIFCACLLPRADLMCSLYLQNCPHFRL